MTSRLTVCADPPELATRAADLIVAAAADAIAARGVFRICLSGGETPRGTYARLGGPLAGAVDWPRVEVFWGDERCVPLTDPDCHFTLASELLLSHVPIPQANIHRMRGDDPDPDAAVRYEEDLRTLSARSGGLPEFDLVLLGMGEDGHVASVFPGSDGDRERQRWVVDHMITKRGQRARRLTLTLPVLAAARDVLVLVCGDVKAAMLALVIGGGVDVPAARLARDAASVHWLADSAAARQLAVTA